MISDLILNGMKPCKENPETAVNLVHPVIANAISQYVTSLFSKALYLATGTVSLGPFTGPFAATCVSPLTPTFLFPEYKVKNAMTLGKGELIWPKLFANIGSHMEIVYKSWKCIPAIVAFPVCTFSTAHFASIGLQFYTHLQSLDAKVIDSLKEDSAKLIWDLFENYLHIAIKTTIPVIVQISGMVGCLVFNGAGTITFATL